MDTPSIEIRVGDALELLKQMPSESVQCVVTSPPYWGLRDYGNAGQLGLEETPELYTRRMAVLFDEVRRVLFPQGTLWLNLGDSYAGGTGGTGSFQTSNAGSFHCGRSRPGMVPGEGAKLNGRNRNGIGSVKTAKPKDLVGIPWRVAFTLQARGWFLRSDIIWHKPNPMPESVTDRPTKAHEYVFLLTKSERYFYDAAAVKEPLAAVDRRGRGRVAYAGKSREMKDGFRHPVDYMGQSPDGKNRRSVWTVPTQSFKGAHFAVMPEALVEPCIMAGSHAGGLVLDPFCGSGTVGAVAKRRGRSFIGLELNPEYAQMARDRIASVKVPTADPAAPGSA